MVTKYRINLNYDNKLLPNKMLIRNYHLNQVVIRNYHLNQIEIKKKAAN